VFLDADRGFGKNLREAIACREFAVENQGAEFVAGAISIWG